MHDQVAKVETSISGRGKLFWAVAILVSVGIMVGVAVGVALPGALEAQNEPGQDVSSATRADQNGATVSIGAFNPASTSRPGKSYTGEVDDTPSGASAVSAQGSAPGIPDKPTGTAIFIGGVDLEWNDVPGADFYDVQLFRNEQWMDPPGNGVEIAFYGAGAIVSELDPGSSYTFHVRAGNAGGSSDWSDYLLMNSTNQSVSGRRARPANLAASGAVVVNGIPQISRVLTTDATGISDGNGLDRVQFRFQWVSNDGSTDADIASATGSSYTLSANDEGRTIKVRVAFTDRGGYAESLTSSATAAVGLRSNIEATGAPTITGTAQVGNTLTADTSSIADADGLANVSYSYQWIANDGTSDTDIQNATGSSYTLAAADEGKTIKVRVSFTDDAGNDETLTSAATVVVAAQSLDAESARYEITFTGLFDADALGAGVDVPRNANFRKLVGSRHDQNISYWSEGASASEGLKILAEHGRTDSFEDEIADSVSDGRALGSFETVERRLRPTAEAKLQFRTTRDFPLVTLAAKINPTPDWFIAIGALSLRPDGEWEREIVVDLYPWDAGTQDGTEFERHTPATNPPGAITTLRNTGKFSDSPIARVAFTLLVPPQVRDVTADTGDGQIEIAWTKVDRAAGYKVQWKSGSEGFGDAATTGREHVIEDGESDGYAISNLTNGAEYTVRVIATNPAGDGEPSVEVTATPLDPAADDVLVSNIHQNPALSAQLPVSVSDPRYLQGFTTGAGATTVESITLPDLSSVETNAAVTLSLYSDVGGAPGTLLHTFTPPQTLATGVDATFTPPAGAIITLAANTSHFIQIDHSAGSLAMSFTKADAEDPDSDPGWSLANDCQTRSSTDTVYSTCLFSKALRVSIQGPPAVSAPALSISDASATEGSSVELTVVMSKPAADSVTVQYSTRDGTATGTDYTAAAGATLTFAPGETEQTISIATTDDTADEDDEDFTVTLSNPSENAALGASSSATGTIVNNDETALTDATLSALTLTDNNGAAIGLTPAFARYSFVYSASVANDIDSLTATATKNSNGASVVFVGADDTSTPGEAGYELEVGNNLVKAMVTSPDANRVKIYMVNVARAASDDATLVSLSLADANATMIALNPATFDADTTEYTASVAGDIDSATVTVAANHSGASVLIITAAGSEAAKSATVDLPPGDTFIKVMVTAEDGQTSKIYSVFVTRPASGQESDATLSSYSLAGSDAAELLVAPSFNPEFGSYYSYVENDIASVTVTAIANRPEATMVFLDGQRTGTPGQVSRNLAVGSTRVKVVVTAEDGITEKIYQIFVLRAPSDAATDSSLSELTLTDSAGTTIDLNPATFDPTTTAYTASVGNEVNAVEVITLATDSNAEPFIIGTDARISIEQGDVELAVGENLIKVTVYAEDHATTTTYNVIVTRAASDDSGDATLSSLTLSDGVGTDIGLTPIFDPATIGYTASVANEIASVTLTATKNNTGASVVIIEADGTSTPDSATVDLDVGTNLIKAMVTSQDGLASMIYSVTVSRAASNDATLSSLTLVDSNGSGVLVTPTFQPSEGVYTALVANGVDSVTATATLNDGDASMIFVGDTDTSTPAEITQDLAVGSNLVKAMVTAEDGATTKIYMVTVTRPAANAATDRAESAHPCGRRRRLRRFEPAIRSRNHQLHRNGGQQCPPDHRVRNGGAQRSVAVDIQ